MGALPIGAFQVALKVQQIMKANRQRVGMFTSVTAKAEGKYALVSTLTRIGVCATRPLWSALCYKGGHHPRHKRGKGRSGGECAEVSGETEHVASPWGAARKPRGGGGGGLATTGMELGSQRLLLANGLLPR